MQCKKVFAAAMAVLLCFCGCFMQTQAADDAQVRLSVPQAYVFEGGTVAVTMTLDRPLQDVVSFDWQLRFDSALFALQSAVIGGSHADMRVSNLKSDADGDYYSVSFVDKTSQGSALHAGTVCTLTFRAAGGLTADRTAVFSLVSEGVYDAAFSAIPVSAGDAVSVTVRRVLPEKLVLDKPPDKTAYRYRDTLDTTGLQLSLVYNDGTSEPVASGFSCTPTAFTVQDGLPMFGLNGDVPVTVSYRGLETTFTVRVRLTAVQWLIKIFLFGWLWY